MNKKVPIIMICALALLSSISYQSAVAQEQSDLSLYSEQVLENFEETVYTKKNIVFQKTASQDADLSMQVEFPAPVLDSKKYLGVKINGKNGDTFKIVPEKELKIEGYCRSIEMWVNGRGFAAELSVLVKDASNQVHRLIFPERLNFQGWRKLKVLITDDVNQQDEFLNQKKYIRILEFQYRPMNMGRLSIWHYFYIDHITATVRAKYTDRQSDDW